jgi:hypothetical protein
MRQTFFFSLFVILLSCGSDKTASESPEPIEDTEVSENLNLLPAVFKINIENLRVRDQPGTKGKELLRLPAGAEVTGLGEFSDFTTAVSLRGVNYEDPWVKIKTNSGQEGWVYAGGLQLNRQSELGKQLIDQRFDSFFGPGTAMRVNQYIVDFQKVSDAASFAQIYREVGVLADTINVVLSDRILLDNLSSEEAYPDLSWLNESLPGFVPELVAEGTSYYMFLDFRQWYPLAEKTVEKADNEFLDLMVQVHPMDSVAYFFPSWFLQTWDYGGNSLLGKGIHLKILEKIEQIQSNTDLFNTEIRSIKESLIGDIIGQDELAYEMPQKDIFNELDQILSRGLTVLTKEDMVALRQRRKMFENPEGNKIRVNQRSGAY